MPDEHSSDKQLHEKHPKKGGTADKYKWWIVGGLAVVAAIVFWLVNRNQTNASTQAASGNTPGGVPGYAVGSEGPAGVPGTRGGAGPRGPRGPRGPGGHKPPKKHHRPPRRHHRHRRHEGRHHHPRKRHSPPHRRLAEQHSATRAFNNSIIPPAAR